MLKVVMLSIVVPSRIELEYQVPETCVLSVVLRDQKGKTTGKNFVRWSMQLSVVTHFEI